MPWNHNGNDEPRLKFANEELYKNSSTLFISITLLLLDNCSRISRPTLLTSLNYQCYYNHTFLNFFIIWI